MIKRTTSALTLACVLFLCAGIMTTQAQTKADPSQKIGYVNPQQILQDMPKYQAVRQRIKNYVKDKRQDIQKQSQSFQEEVSNFQQHQSVMSKDAKQSEQKKLGKLRANLQQAQQQAQQDIQKKQQSLMQPLREKIQDGIQDVAKQLDLSYVVSASSLLYVSDNAKKNFNITEKVEKSIGVDD
jgi:outer membrane protein